MLKCPAANREAREPQQPATIKESAWLLVAIGAVAQRQAALRVAQGRDFFRPVQATTHLSLFLAWSRHLPPGLLLFASAALPSPAVASGPTFFYGCRAAGYARSHFSFIVAGSRRVEPGGERGAGLGA